MQQLPARLQSKILANIDSLPSSSSSASSIAVSSSSSSTSSATTILPQTAENIEKNLTIVNDAEHQQQQLSNTTTSFNQPTKNGIKNIPGLINLNVLQQQQHQQNDNTDKNHYHQTEKYVLDSPIKRSFDYIEPLWLKNVSELIKNDQNLMKHLKISIYKLTEIHKFQLYSNDWMKYLQYRKRLQQNILILFENNLRFCCENNLDSYFWKILYYNVLQFLKCSYKPITKFIAPTFTTTTTSTNNQFNNDSDDENFKEKSLYLIEDGLKYYETFLMHLERKYHFQRNTLSISKLNNRKNDSKSLILYKLITQKIYLNIGDLLRYKEYYTGLTNYNCNEAKQYYEKAQKLMPTNGIPYNQLAVIAINYNNIFDAIYYHIRSLTTSNPIISAKESLKVLFDEIRKKYDEKFQIKLLNENSSTMLVEKQQTQLQPQTNELSNNMTNFRKEIWIHPNGSRKYCFNSDEITTTTEKFNVQEKISRTDDIKAAISSSYELKKEFLISYMYVIGKLFTGIGLENFENSMFQMLYEFNICMQKYPSIMKNQRLLEIMTVNVFLFDYHNHKIDIKPATTTTTAATAATESAITIIKEVQFYAFKVGLFMFGIIVNRINDLFDEHYSIEFNTTSTTTTDYLWLENIPNEINELLQSIKIWCNWMSLNLNLCTIKKTTYLNDLNEITPWKNFAKLLTKLSKLLITFEQKYKNKDVFNHDNNNEENSKSNNHYQLQLEENIFLSGFKPFKNILDNIFYININEINEKNAKIYFRINEIVKFAENFLCQQGNDLSSILTLEIDSKTNEKKFMKNNHRSFTNDDNDLKDNFDNENTILMKNEKQLNHRQDNSLTTESDEIACKLITNLQLSSNFELNELQTRKTLLEKSTKAQKIYAEKLQNILEDTKNSIQIVEIKPKYLLPDTNCFIDYLDELEQLLMNKNTGYNLMIPLVVLNELEGLSKGFKSSSSSSSRSYVTNSRIHHFDEVASYSGQALEFIKSKSKFNNIKCCTTKGSILKNTSAFKLDELDDALLSNDDKILSTALSLATENYSRLDDNGKSFIRTEVVLLTTDRNLRVKALAKNLAVSGLKEFLNWTEGKDF